MLRGFQAASTGRLQTRHFVPSRWIERGQFSESMASSTATEIQDVGISTDPGESVSVSVIVFGEAESLKCKGIKEAGLECGGQPQG